MIQYHEIFMQRCIQLAKLGQGNVAPNPLVGCVIVHNNKIVAEGYHQVYGDAHAEVNAINKIKDRSILAECTLYVSLEPCSHFGKTPPCANLLVHHKVKMVVIGCLDESEKVNGKGIEILKNAGIEVIVGVLENECIKLNKQFFKFHNQKRPYIILKWAQSANGFIGKKNIVNVAISNDLSKVINHQWRAMEHAILIGANTANIDNPSLTTRLVMGKNPIRFVIDLNNKLVKNLNLLNDENSTYIFSCKPLANSNNVNYLLINNRENCLPEILTHLYNLNIQSLIVEGGTKTIQQFVNNNLWDEARIFKSNINLVGDVKAPELKHYNLYKKQDIVDGKGKNDSLEFYYFGAL